MYVDVGTNGRISDAEIWSKSTLKAHLQRNSFKSFNSFLNFCLI